MCLVLDKRINNWFKICKDWQQIGFPVIPYIVGDGSTLDNEVYSRIDIQQKPPLYNDTINYPTWINNYSPYNAWLSHREIFKIFINECENYEYLLLLEDDIYIEPDFHEILIKCEDDINQLEPDMLYLGSYNLKNTWSPTLNPNLLKCKGTGGFHSVLLKRKIVNQLLKFDPIGPYDWIAGNYLHHHFNCFCIFPCIVSQSSGWSFIENCELNKPARDFIGAI